MQIIEKTIKREIISEIPKDEIVVVIIFQNILKKGEGNDN